MAIELLPEGTQVEFVFPVADGEATLTYNGVILGHLPPKGDFKGGYRIACYYVVDPEDVRKIEGPSPNHLNS